MYTLHVHAVLARRLSLQGQEYLILELVMKVECVEFVSNQTSSPEAICRIVPASTPARRGAPNCWSNCATAASPGLTFSFLQATPSRVRGRIFVFISVRYIINT